MAYSEVPAGSLQLGDRVRIYGHTKTFENNKEFEFTTFADSVIKLNTTPGTPIVPKNLKTNEALNESNQGLLVKVEGKVLSVEDGGLSFVVDDGSGPVLVFTDGYINTQSGPVPSVNVGDTLQAVGLAGKYSAGIRIRVRDVKELIVTAKGVSGVTLDQSEMTLTVGETKSLVATDIPADATNPAVTWSSDKPSVATVDDTGKVTAVWCRNSDDNSNDGRRQQNGNMYANRVSD